MQQRSAKPGSSHTPLMRGLSLIGSIGMLSSGMVWAQTQTSPDGASSAATSDSPLTVEVLPSNQALVAPVATPAIAPEESALVAPVTPPATDPKPAPVWEKSAGVAPQPITAAEPEGWAPSAIAPPTPKLSNPDNLQVNPPSPAATLPNLAAPEEGQLSVEKANAETPVDYNNLYIDPTSYSIGATSDYSEPSAVVLSERSSGCQTVVEQGQGVEGSLCGEALEGPKPDTASAIAGTAETNIGMDVSEQQEQPIAQTQQEQPIAQSQQEQLNVQTQLVQPIAQKQPVQTIPASQQLQIVAPVPVPIAPQPLQIAAPVPVPIAPPRPVQPIAQIEEVQFYPQTEEVAETAIESRDVGTVNVSSNGNSVRTPLPPPGPGGFYYSSSMVRPVGLAGNGNISLMFPLAIASPITSAFGWRMHPISGISSFHSGTDLGADMGTPVLAAYGGKVAIADYLGGYGLAVVLQHNNGTQETLYGHLSEIFVKPGDAVIQGNAIGRVGSTGNSTGPHLHFEYRQMTKDGWVTLDPGAQLENALAQLIKAMQTAQSTPKLKAG